MKEISEPTLSGMIEHGVLLEELDSPSRLVLEFEVASRPAGFVHLACRSLLDLP